MTSQFRGARLERWLDNPTDESCPIEPSTLTLEDLVEDRKWSVEQMACPRLPTWRSLSDKGLVCLPDYIQEGASALGLPSDRVYRNIDIKGDKGSIFGMSMFEHNYYEFYVGPGCIFAMNSNRIDGHHWSDIALAVYHYFQRETLEWVFRVNVVNVETNDIVTKALYKNENRVSAQAITPRVCLRGTPEFTAVLGTPNIQGVAALVLGGFPDGKKTIREIYTWYSGLNMWLQMAVRISDVE